MKQFNVTNIVWDVDEYDLDVDEYDLNLPTEEVVECDDEDRIADTLSDKYGWCIKSFNIN
jgi:hypothetical protein